MKSNYLIYSHLYFALFGRKFIPVIFFNLFLQSLFALQVTRSPSSVASDGSVGSVDWTLPGNAVSSNNSYATAALNCSDSYYIKASNFGFSLLSSYVVTGISADFEVSKASSGGTMTYLNVRIVKADGSIGWFEMDGGGGWMWGTGDVYSSVCCSNYGSSADDWGETGYWTPTTVNDPDFGVAFNVSETGCGGSITSRVDHMQITIYYNAPAPVQLLDFDAIVTNNKDETGKNVLLTWKAYVETGLKNYFVERSADGIGFELSGTIDNTGSGQSGPVDYSFRDENPLTGKSYYRLYCSDQYGFSYLLETREVFVNPEMSFSIRKIYPNPARDHTAVTYFIPDNNKLKVTLFIYNILGQQILEKDIGHPGSGNRSLVLDLPAASFREGIYTLKIIRGEEEQMIRFSVDR